MLGDSLNELRLNISPGRNLRLRYLDPPFGSAFQLNLARFANSLLARLVSAATATASVSLGAVRLATATRSQREARDAPSSGFVFFLHLSQSVGRSVGWSDDEDQFGSSSWRARVAQL